jgi:5-deoxy-D-glucuronate isomerase
MRQAIELSQMGEDYSALDNYKKIAQHTYKDGTDNMPLKFIKDIMTKIDDDASKINVAEVTARNARMKFFKDAEAHKYIDEALEKVTSYLQETGYYALMNPSWGYHNPSKGRTS